MSSWKILFNIVSVSINLDVTLHNDFHDNSIALELAISIVDLAVGYGSFLWREDCLVELAFELGGSLIKAAPGLEVVSIFLVNVLLCLFIGFADHEGCLVLEVIFLR